LACNSAEIFTS